MSALNQIIPLLAGASEISIRLSRSGDAVTALVLPRIDKVDPDEPDESIRILTAALAQPFRFTCAIGADVDAAFGAALTELAGQRREVANDLAFYREQSEQARERAREASAAKAKPVGKPVAKPAKPTTTKAPAIPAESTDNDDEGDEAATSAQAATATAAADVVTDADKGVANLFGED